MDMSQSIHQLVEDFKNCQSGKPSQTKTSQINLQHHQSVVQNNLFTPVDQNVIQTPNPIIPLQLEANTLIEDQPYERFDQPAKTLISALDLDLQKSQPTPIKIKKNQEAQNSEITQNQSIDQKLESLKQEWEEKDKNKFSTISNTSSKSISFKLQQGVSSAQKDKNNRINIKIENSVKQQPNSSVLKHKQAKQTAQTDAQITQKLTQKSSSTPRQQHQNLSKGVQNQSKSGQQSSISPQQSKSTPQSNEAVKNISQSPKKSLLLSLTQLKDSAGKINGKKQNGQRVDKLEQDLAKSGKQFLHQQGITEQKTQIKHQKPKSESNNNFDQKQILVTKKQQCNNQFQDPLLLSKSVKKNVLQQKPQIQNNSNKMQQKIVKQDLNIDYKQIKTAQCILQEQITVAKEQRRLQKQAQNNQSINSSQKNNIRSPKSGITKIEHRGDFIIRWLDALIQEEKIVAITRISTGRTTYKNVPRVQYEELKEMNELDIVNRI